jgi:hypothetical protein
MREVFHKGVADIAGNDLARDDWNDVAISKLPSTKRRVSA